jgi:hypothetical protein
MLIILMVIVPVMPRGLNSALRSAAAGVAEAGDRPILVQVEQGPRAVRYLVDGVDLESRGGTAAAGASVAKVGSAGAAQGGREAGLRRSRWSDRRRSDRGSGERWILDAGI